MTKNAALIGVFLLAAALLPAQEIGIEPPYIAVPPHLELKAYLNLTDAQVLAIQQVQKDREAAQRAVYKQIEEKQRTLNFLMESGSRDALQIGQLMIDIATLQKEVPKTGSYRESALAILTPDQKAKLPGLVTVLLQQSIAWQAVNWNLIDAPGQPIRILPIDANTPIARTLPAPAERTR